MLMIRTPEQALPYLGVDVTIDRNGLRSDGRVVAIMSKGIETQARICDGNDPRKGSRTHDFPLGIVSVTVDPEKWRPIDG